MARKQHGDKEDEDDREKDPENEPEEEQDTADPDTTTGKSKRKRKRKRSKKKDDNENNNQDDDDKDETSSPHPVDVDEESNKKTAQVDRTVFVEGIPFTCTPEAVREFFLRHLSSRGHDNGDDAATTNIIITDLRLPVWQDSGRLRGYGHVVLATTALRDAALQLSGQYLQNRYLTIQPAQAPKAVVAPPAAASSIVDHTNPSATIALHNLSYQAVEDDIVQAVQRFGPIVSAGGVRIVRHSATGRSKGFAYVQFESVSSAQKAVKAAPLHVAGRPCRVDYDHGRVRGSFRTADRKLWHKEYNNPASNNNIKRARNNKDSKTSQEGREE
eukprot:scaffold24048_cov194-Amphora_coffeaeformis.AAC.21